MKRWLLLAALIGSPLAAQEPLTLASPDGSNTVTVTLDKDGRASYSIARRGEVLIAPSPIALALTDGRVGYAMRVTGAERSSADTRYPIVVGKAKEGRDQHNQLTVHLVETAATARRMDVVLRAYDDGIAFRTVLPEQAATAAAVIAGEETEFRVLPTAKCWGFNVGKFGSSHEGEFDPFDVSKVRDHNRFDLPVTCRTDRAALVLTESDLVDYSGMYLAGRGDGGGGFRALLSPSLDDGGVAVRTKLGAPIRTPWRVVMLADKAGQLAGSTLISDLATPSKIADTSWIKPGLSSWDWWNGYALDSVPGYGTNTANAKAYIDFAARQGFAYAMIDDGWYAGSGQAPKLLPGTDLTRSAPGFDLDEVVAYADAKGVKLWLWAHWGAIDAQMEEAFALYQKHGIAGVKIDFMDRDDQAIVDWYHKVLESAARHKLMINFHGAYVPRGLNRTWPNFVTQEGVLGAEYNKWSKRITARHNVMLAYTRGLIGPMDYTPGGFRNVSPEAFEHRNAYPYVQTTRAHGLAMYVVYDSPLGLVSDSPDTYRDSPAGLEFLKGLPTSWDETQFLGGEVGDYIAIARRKGRTWYVGVLNNEIAREVELPMAMLGRGRWRARSWTDGAAPDAVTTATVEVTADQPMRLSLGATGGAVASLTPR